MVKRASINGQIGFLRRHKFEFGLGANGRHGIIARFPYSPDGQGARTATINTLCSWIQFTAFGNHPASGTDGAVDRDIRCGCRDRGDAVTARLLLHEAENNS